jgi:hypothetical protein
MVPSSFLILPSLFFCLFSVLASMLVVGLAPRGLVQVYTFLYLPWVNRWVHSVGVYLRVELL